MLPGLKNINLYMFLTRLRCSELGKVPEVRLGHDFLCLTHPFIGCHSCSKFRGVLRVKKTACASRLRLAIARRFSSFSSGLQFRPHLCGMLALARSIASWNWFSTAFRVWRIQVRCRPADGSRVSRTYGAPLRLLLVIARRLLPRFGSTPRLSSGRDAPADGDRSRPVIMQLRYPAWALLSSVDSPHPVQPLDSRAGRLTAGGPAKAQFRLPETFHRAAPAPWSSAEAMPWSIGECECIRAAMACKYFFSDLEHLGPFGDLRPVLSNGAGPSTHASSPVKAGPSWGQFSLFACRASYRSAGKVVISFAVPS